MLARDSQTTCFRLVGTNEKFNCCGGPIRFATTLTTTQLHASHTTAILPACNCWGRSLSGPCRPARLHTTDHAHQCWDGCLAETSPVRASKVSQKARPCS